MTSKKDMCVHTKDGLIIWRKVGQTVTGMSQLPSAWIGGDESRNLHERFMGEPLA
jgi:hypothetical protein